MRNVVAALAFVAATSAAEASSFVVLGEQPPARTPSIVMAGGDEPARAVSLVYLDFATPATAFDRERERSRATPQPPAAPPLAHASVPTVIRGGIQGEAFSRGSSPVAQPATAGRKDVAQPATPAAAKKSSAPARPATPAPEPRRKQAGSKPPSPPPAPAVPVKPETTIQ